MAKGYMKLELILEVESGDFTLEEGHFLEDDIIETFENCDTPNFIKVVQTSIDSTEYNQGIEDGFEDLF